MPKKVFTLNDFSGGLNTDKSSRALEDNELAECTNFDVSSKGKIVASRIFNQTSLYGQNSSGAAADPGYGLFTLIIINLVVNLVLMLNKIYISRRFTKFRLVVKPNFDSQIIKAAFVFTLISFVNVLVTRIDVLMISILGTIEEAGIYAVAYKLALEGIFLRNMASTAFFPISIKFFNENKIKSSILLGYSLLFFTVAFIFAFGASFFIEPVINFAFGNDYNESAQVLKILIFFLAFVWATLPYTISATSTHNEDILLYSSIIMAVLHIPLNIILFYSYGIIGIAYSLVIVYFIGSIIQCSLIHRRLKETGYLV